MSNIVLAPPPGLFTDDTSFSANGKWVEGSNVRFWNGKPEVIGGWVQRNSLVLGATPLEILEWKSSAGTTYVAYGATTKLYVETSSTLYDITPSGFTSTTGWTFATYGDTLIANATGGKIYQWSLNTGVAAAQVTNAPVAVTAILVTQERQLLAFGCNEELSGTFNGRCIRGSDIEDITDWTTTATNNAFEHILDGAASLIVCAKRISSYVAIWTQTELWVGQFIGDPSQTYRFDRGGTNCGSVGLRGVAIANETAFWLDNDTQFHSWAPGGVPTEIPCSVIDLLRSQIVASTKAAKTFACHVAKYDEIWFHYANSGAVYFGRYVAFSMTDGTWFKGTTERRAMHQGLTNVIAALNNGNLVTCESGKRGEGNSVAALVWSLESGDYYIDKAQRRMMLRTVWPDFQNQAGNVSLVIKTSEYPQASEVSQTALTLTTSTTKKDFRASGKLILFTFSGNDASGSTDTFARFGSLTFDAVPVGRR